ncbi:MAG: hypothetical protein QOJ38_1991 [Solirubrobacterales bacterium]|jgi:hypothetical protein|nr:hypothetical protein [Solirubrobacterales bacterium]
MDKRLLSTYLNDHLAGATAGTELARRASGAHEGSKLGMELAQLAEEIAEDRASLEGLMDGLGITRNQLKVGMAWVGERAGRLKLNGRLLERSPLSDLLELEILHLGVLGKRDLWQALRVAFGDELEGFDLGALEDRASDQERRLARFRLGAAESALSGGGRAA